MPYIAINTADKLSNSQKDKIKAELGRLITIIPTKSEAGLIVDFSDSRTIYKGGENVPGAFIDVRFFRKVDFEPKKQLTEEIFELLTRELDIRKEHMYLTVMETDTWGYGGTLNS